ncbi:MAG: CoA transferase [Chloroflexi bacterium]|nr:CoA transferase [Chloroflexota bacterium]
MSDQIRPLTGIRVLALEQFVAGPFGTMVLADMGAEVVKIERPDGGDQTRAKRFTVPRQAPIEGARGDGATGTALRGSEGTHAGEPLQVQDSGLGTREVGQFTLWNRNKKSVTLDLQSKAGKDLLRQLVRTSDVLWENMKPGSLARLGFSADELRALNPRLIYTSVSGFGHQDIYQHPQGGRTAFDIIPQALSGLMHVAAGPGREPKWLGAIIGDVFPSLMAAFGVVLALRHREQTGLGQHVDLAMYDACVMLNERALGLYLLTGQDLTQATDRFVSPQDSFPCRDGYVVVAPQSQQTWQAFCRAIEREDLLDHPDLATPSLRSLNFRDLINPAFATWARDKTRIEVVTILTHHGVPAAPVQTNAEVVADPQIAARRMLIELDDPLAGPSKVIANAIKLSACPDTPAGPPPRLGEHTDAVLGEWLGLDRAAIEQLHRDRVV